MKLSRLFGIVALLVPLLSCAWLYVSSSRAAPLQNPLITLVTERSLFEGQVQERMDAGSYTYLAVRDGDRIRWAVTMGKGAPRGARVRVRGMGTKSEFYSRRLKRTFRDLVFGVVSTLD